MNCSNIIKIMIVLRSFVTPLDICDKFCPILTPPPQPILPSRRAGISPILSIPHSVVDMKAIADANLFISPFGTWNQWQFLNLWL